MNDQKKERPIRVLSLDGGGMRGLYTATLLSSLATTLRGKSLDIGSGFDVIVGTSTGGILATALAVGVPIEEIISLYRKVGPKIFTDPQPQSTLGTFQFPKGGIFKLFFWCASKGIAVSKDPFVAWCKRNFSKAANDPSALREELTRLFGTTTYGELYEKRRIGLCLPAVKILDEKLRIFKTPHVSKKNYDVNLTLVDACMATSAAPLYLPLAAIPNPQLPESDDVYADGGLAVNNPVLIGLIEALQLAGNTEGEAGQGLRPIEIFSIGTCAAPDGAVIRRQDLNRGLSQWQMGAKALSLSMNAQASATNFAAQYLVDWLNRHSTTSVKLVRFPEATRSEAHMKFLKMDNASEECCQAFMSFGTDDAMAAKSICDKGEQMGQLISKAFQDMTQLKIKETNERL